MFGRKKEQDLGGTHVSPSDKPKDTWGISRRLQEQKLNGNILPQDPNEVIGEDPGTNVPGIYFVKGKVEEAPLFVQEEAKKSGQSVKKAVVFGALAVVLGGTLFLLTRDHEDKENPNP